MKENQQFCMQLKEKKRENHVGQKASSNVHKLSNESELTAPFNASNLIRNCNNVKFLLINANQSVERFF